MTHMDNYLIGVEEAGEMLGISRQGVLRRVERGDLTPLTRIGKRRTLIFSKDVIKAIAAHENKGANKCLAN